MLKQNFPYANLLSELRRPRSDQMLIIGFYHLKNLKQMRLGAKALNCMDYLLFKLR
jgi:hypothetical protein